MLDAFEELDEQASDLIEVIGGHALLITLRI
jgi:hypothetical protein